MARLHAILVVIAALLALSACTTQETGTGTNGSVDAGAGVQGGDPGPLEDYENDSNDTLHGESVTPLEDNVEGVATQDVAYFPGTTGFLARPEQEGDYPGVVMVHEWWGLNDNIRTMAKTLAAQGYTVLAVDLYHGEVATTPEQARALVGGVQQGEASANLRAAAAYLREQEGAGKVASLGWCFGGGQSLNLALSGEPLDATVIYYGQLETDPEELSAISWPVLGIFGRDDASIPVETVEAFEASLDAQGIPNEVRIYDGVGHAFANPSSASYSSEQAQDAWARTVAFLEQNLKAS